MLRIVMYGPDAEENHRIRELMEDLLWDAQIKPVFKEFNGEREPFFAYVKNNTYLIMLVVQSGPEGMETVRLAKERNPETRIVWFSDHDYALYAFDLRLTFFGLLPASRKKMLSALNNCCHSSRYPPWSDRFSLSQTTPFPQHQIRPVGNKKTPLTGVQQA